MTAAIVITLLCIVASACFSGFENGMLAIRRARLDHAAGEGRLSALLMRKFLDNPGLMLGTILLGNNFANVFSAIFFDEIVQHQFGTAAIYTTLGSLLLTFCVLIFGEISPKVWFRQAPMTRCAVLVFPMYGIYLVLKPAITALNAIAQLVDRMFGGSGKQRVDVALIREEFRAFVLESTREGQLDPDAARILDSALGYTGETAASLMTPIASTRTLSAQITLREAVRIAEDSNTSRFPITRDDDSEGRWIGLFSVYDAIFAIPVERWDSERVIDHFRPLITIGETVGIDQVLRQADATRTPLLAVIGNDRRPIGVISVRDVLRPLFGELDS